MEVIHMRTWPDMRTWEHERLEAKRERRDYDRLLHDMSGRVVGFIPIRKGRTVGGPQLVKR